MRVCVDRSHVAGLGGSILFVVCMLYVSSLLILELMFRLSTIRLRDSGAWAYGRTGNSRRFVA